MSHPVVQPKTYAFIFALLIALTVLTVCLSKFANLGNLEVVVALTIAGVKALLVVFFFMHLWQSSRLIQLAMGGAVLFLGIMLSLTLADYTTRDWQPLPRVQPLPANEVAVEH